MRENLSPKAYEELIEHTVDVLNILDESGTILYESPSVKRVLGYEPGENEGDKAFEKIHPDDRQKALDTFYEVIDADKTFTSSAVELRYKHKDGSWIWLESRGSNQTSTMLDGYVVASREISERMESKQKLQRERDRLERFASVVSHDLRNPLNVIEGRLELAQEEYESDHLDAIEESVDRMNELVDDLLALAREGDAEPLLDAVSLRDIGENCWQNVETKHARLDIQTERTILADESQFRQVLENLFRNAIEHGGEDVTITIGGLADGFYIKDDGRGIPENERDNLLEYGFSTKSDGTGFGLSIVNEIVSNHGWTLTISEADDGGARFEVRNVTFA